MAYFLFCNRAIKKRKNFKQNLNCLPGIGYMTAERICKKAGFNPSASIEKISPRKMKKLEQTVLQLMEKGA